MPRLTNLPYNWLMPTIARIGPYRFFFYANEGTEPPHIHVKRGEGSAKFWLDPVSLVRSRNFAARELRRIESIVTDHAQRFQEAWHEFFDR